MTENKFLLLTDDFFVLHLLINNVSMNKPITIEINSLSLLVANDLSFTLFIKYCRIDLTKRTT